MTLCRPCSDLQLSVTAMRIVGKTPMCDKHFRSAMGMPKLETVRGEKQMAKALSENTRAEILKLAAEGLSAETIRKQVGVAWITAKNVMDGTGAKAMTAGQTKRAKSKGSLKPRTVALYATVEICDGIWNSLSLEKKAALLNELTAVS